MLTASVLRGNAKRNVQLFCNENSLTQQTLQSRHGEEASGELTHRETELRLVDLVARLLQVSKKILLTAARLVEGQHMMIIEESKFE